jgi:hypothetical protein
MNEFDLVSAGTAPSLGVRRSLLLAGLSFSALLTIMMPMTMHSDLSIAVNYALADDGEGGGEGAGEGGEGDGDNNDHDDGDAEDDDDGDAEDDDDGDAEDDDG